MVDAVLSTLSAFTQLFTFAADSTPASTVAPGTLIVAVGSLISALLAYRQATRASRDTTRLAVRKANLEEFDSLRDRNIALQQLLDNERERRFDAEEQVARLRRSLINSGVDLPEVMARGEE
jgi:hypothetical protein